MPFLSDQRAVAISSTVENVLANKFNRVLQAPSKITVAITSELPEDGFATVIVGREILIDDQLVPDTNAFPRNPEDILVQTVAAAGEEIIVKVRNADAAATNDIRTAVWIQEI